MAGEIDQSPSDDLRYRVNRDVAGRTRKACWRVKARVAALQRVEGRRISVGAKLDQTGTDRRGKLRSGPHTLPPARGRVRYRAGLYPVLTVVNIDRERRPKVETAATIANDSRAVHNKMAVLPRGKRPRIGNQYRHQVVPIT